MHVIVYLRATIVYLNYMTRFEKSFMISHSINDRGECMQIGYIVSNFSD